MERLTDRYKFWNSAATGCLLMLFSCFSGLFRRGFIRVSAVAVCLHMLFPGCSTLISDEFPAYDTQPVLNSILVAGDSVRAHVSFAEKIDTTYLEGTDAAEVYYSSDQSDLLHLEHLDSGLYYHPHVTEPGEIVVLSAELPGHGEVRAMDTIPFLVPVEIVDHTNRARYNEDGNYMAGITLRFTDDPGTTDFYELVLRNREEDQLWIKPAFNNNLDILLNEGIDPYSTSSLVFSDQLFEDAIVEMWLEFSAGGSGKHCYGADSCFEVFDAHTLIAELRHVSAAYYRFKKQFYLYEKARNTEFIEGTAVTISNYSNVENGLGIVASYASSVDSLFVPKDSVLTD